MSDLYRPLLAPLPLLLWKTPPGLELILSQEGISHELVREAHPFAFQRGSFVLFDGRRTSAAELRPLLTSRHILLNIDALRFDEPTDPFEALIDHQSARMRWDLRECSLSERVSRHPKGWIRRRLIASLREWVTQAGGLWIRLAPFPYPFRSSFSLRVDLDEPAADDYHRFAMTRNLLSDCCTHFVSTQAYEAADDVLDDLRRHDTQSHGHFHYVYRDPEANRRNLERADRFLSEKGFEPSGFSGPHGRWNPGLDDAIERLGYCYSSDFQLGYDDFPFFPWKQDRFSRVLQVPAHPVCEGLFLDAGVADGRIVADHLRRVVEAKFAAGEPAIVYGHPERRLGRMPEILIALHRLLERSPLVWRTTMTELARWWRWRDGRKYIVLSRDGRSVEVQFDDWDPEYPIALEIHRGPFISSLPVHGPRTVVKLDELAYERVSPLREPLSEPPQRDPRHLGFKDTVRRALDWETVTPLEELSAATLPDRLKRGLRWWKSQRTGTSG